MKSDDVRKLLRQIFLLRLILLVSFTVALTATSLVISPTLFQSSTYRPPGPVAQSNFVNSTAVSATTRYSSAKSTPPQAYNVLIYGPVNPNTFNYYGLTALISWMVFGGALIWRGHVRSVWGRSRFSYDTFRLLVKMRGARTRLKLMQSLNSPKNKLQLATALGIDWKAVDKHVQVLEKNGLIQATTTSGTAVFYEITEKGRNLIQVLEQLGADIPLSE